jgi:hypothetical protein
MDDKEYVDQVMEKLLLDGSIEFAGVDAETGEMLYAFNDKLKETMPELYDQHLNFVHNEVMHLWEHGFLELSDFTEKNPKVGLTEKAFADEEIAKLSDDLRVSLEEIKRVLRVL